MHFWSQFYMFSTLIFKYNQSYSRNEFLHLSLACFYRKPVYIVFSVLMQM